VDGGFIAIPSVYGFDNLVKFLEICFCLDSLAAEPSSSACFGEFRLTFGKWSASTLLLPDNQAVISGRGPVYGFMKELFLSKKEESSDIISLA